ncbi:MAG: DNA-binding protein YbiB [Burkholderiales bacterium]
MSLVRLIKDIADGAQSARDMPEHDAHDLFAAMLDGGVPDLELGAVLTALRLKSESISELHGFYRAITQRAYALRPPGRGLKPLVFASYCGAQDVPNLLPLVVLMLQRLGIPVLVHGTLEGGAQVATSYILRELGVLPSANLAQAQKALDEDLLAFVPTAVICPGLANLLSLHSRLGVRNSAHQMAKLLNPISGHSVRVASAADAASLHTLEQFFLETGFEALLLTSTDGESYANPRQRPRMMWIRDGRQSVLFEEEAHASRGSISLPLSLNAGATAAWIRLAMAGDVPIPHPIVNQLACCLFVSGYADDMNQAKAIAAVEAGGVSAPGQRATGGLRH